MDIKINDNAKFKNIFNNLDESIIIIKGKNNENFEIDYINEKFSLNF